MQSENDGDLSLTEEQDVSDNQNIESSRGSQSIDRNRTNISNQKRSFGHSHQDSGDLGDLEGLEEEDVIHDDDDENGSTTEISLDGDAKTNTVDTVDTVLSRTGAHRRFDSIPQKYYVESSTSGQRINDLTEEDVSLPHIHFDSQNSSRHVSEIEDAGLDFVDVNLDQGGNGDGGEADISSIGNSPYGPGAYAASRSAIEIRQDSISSNSVKAKQIAQVAEARDNLSTSDATGSRQSKKSFEDIHLHQHQGNRRQSSKSPDGFRRSVEGRYRGRLSTPTSPCHSPDLTPTRESLPDVKGLNENIHGINVPSGGGLVMSFAGDDGDIDTVISPITDNPLPQLSIQEPDEEQEQNDQTEEYDVKEDEDKISEENTNQQAIAVEEEKASGTDVDHDAAINEAAAAATASAIVTSPTDADTSATKTSVDDSNKSPILTDAADKEDKQGKNKRRESSNKPSALEQHLSRTRMTTLPPKPKVEDVKHLHDFEEMMKLSKEMTLKKQQEEEERKNQKDVNLQERMKVWENEILPSWTRARREARLRKLWWKGVPPNLRGRVWALTCGNSQMLPRNLLQQSSSEAKERLQAGTFPKDDLEAIEVDIERTLPTLRLFQKGTGPLYDDLFDVLCAFTVVRLQQRHTQSQSSDDEEGYVYPMGVSSLAAMFLINLSPSEALIALINLIADRPWLRALYSLSATANTRKSLILTNYRFDENKSPSTALSPKSSGGGDSSIGRKSYSSTATLAGFERVFDTLLADQMPKVYANMQARGVRPSAYVNEWIRTMFVPFLPFDAVARLWDCILLEESDSLFFRTGIGLVNLLSSRLYVPEKDELISILRGNNKAALGVWNRLRTGSVDLIVPTSSTSIRSQQQQNKINGNSKEDVEEDENMSHDNDSISTNGNGSIIQSPSIYAPPQFVPVDDIYGGQYGITEDILFRTLDEQDSWWKDSVLERLLDREIVS